MAIGMRGIGITMSTTGGRVGQVGWVLGRLWWMRMRRLAIAPGITRVSECGRMENVVQVQNLLCNQDHHLEIIVVNCLEMSQQPGMEGVEGWGVMRQMADGLLDEQSSRYRVTTGVEL